MAEETVVRGVRYGSSAAEVEMLFRADGEQREPVEDPSWEGTVWSGGQVSRPRLAMVFVNPTMRNQAAKEGWPWEYSAPHVGVRRMWRYLESCGMVDEVELPGDGYWGPADAERVYGAAADAGLYITNLVKACRSTAAMPTAGLARGWLELLLAELAVVKPEYVVTMGGLVTSLVLGKPVRMIDAWEWLRHTGTVMAAERRFADCEPGVAGDAGSMTIVPCYFPCGRGEPGKARDILMALRRNW
jgi:hypothetical protein